MKTPHIALISILTVPVLSGAALAQTSPYPAKPVRVVIPWPAGGSNDFAGRILLQKLSQAMGQQFIVDNRAGASGMIGAELVARSPADGYTLMIHSTTHVSNPWTYKKVPYDTLKDFAPVALIANQPGVLTVHPSLPVKNVKELIALARAKPNTLNYSSSGSGSAPHLSMELFSQMAGVKLVHVPYKGGAPAVTAAVSGEVQVLFPTISSAMTQIQAKRLRAIAVSSPQRVKMLPGVPTIAESGVPGFEMNPWIGMLAPAGMPKEIIDRLNKETARALQMPDVVQQLATQGAEPWIATPEEFAKRLRDDYEKYAKLVKLTGAQPE